LFIGLQGSLEEQAQQFYLRATENHQWAEEFLIGFIGYEKERSKRGEIPDSTIPRLDLTLCIMMEFCTYG
jgi:hypothetical protein